MSEKKKLRRTIPKCVKDSVWNINIGQDKPYGECFICGKQIHIQDFDVGHNKAVTKGGTNNINNLKPICRTCNASMGTMSIEVFKKRYYPKENYDKRTEKKNEKLKPFIGMIEMLEFASDKKLCLTMPHKPEDAKMSFTIESLFEPYINKKIKITIEEQEGSGDF